MKDSNVKCHCGKVSLYNLILEQLGDHLKFLGSAHYLDTLKSETKKFTIRKKEWRIERSTHKTYKYYIEDGYNGGHFTSKHNVVEFIIENTLE